MSNLYQCLLLFSCVCMFMVVSHQYLKRVSCYDVFFVLFLRSIAFGRELLLQCIYLEMFPWAPDTTSGILTFLTRHCMCERALPNSIRRVHTNNEQRCTQGVAWLSDSIRKEQNCLRVGFISKNKNWSWAYTYYNNMWTNEETHANHFLLKLHWTHCCLHLH